MLVKGMIAGFAATMVLSVMMLMKSMVGLLPELDVIGMLGGMFAGGMTIGWVLHFIIGTVAWGGGFALTYSYLPGSSAVIKGIVLGLITWMMMMVIVMPMAGAGFFGLNIGIMTPIMTMMLHVVFGVVLGLVFSKSGSAPVKAAG